jgi:class 3 adenylate cyclase/tetratricopeptide (TPR) repeat protein
MAVVPREAGEPSRADLVSFIPRLTLEWLRDGSERTWRELDGTLAFVDISGFTAMSERLSHLGKQGAEEVTDVMNATFAALLEVAYSYGGGLLKFGGDALLLLFSGDEHEARACRAAFGMRRRLRAIGRPRTAAGVVTLRMHVGIHSGRFHFFLVGDSHRELLVAGPAASRTVEMEAASEAGEILLSPETAAALDSDRLGEPKGPGVLLRGEPTATTRVEPLPDFADVPLENAIPAPLRAQLLEAPPEGEHRSAAVGFVRFAGTDALIETDGPEAAALALQELVRTVQTAAEEHGVTFLESDIDRDSGRIVLVAGAPETAGDDEERLLRTLRAVVDAEPPLPVHIGASRGRVFAGPVGAPFRRTYAILGDTAALAARLMARADANEILVAAEAYERSNARFGAVELEPFQVKGKSAPVRALALGALTKAELRPTERQLPFVDRERERAVLSASVAPVRMGFGTLVELVGDPGIGKSRLADELREQCTDMVNITARCEQYESSTPYFAFRPLLRSVLDVELNGGGGESNRETLVKRLEQVDPDLAPWAPLLAAPLDVDVSMTREVEELEPSFRRARLHGIVGSLLGGLLASPTLILFEDVQWMDEASSDLLRHLGTQLPTRPWLACTTRRPIGGGFLAAEGTPPLPAMTLRLEPLPAGDAKSLIEAAAGRSLTDDEVQAIAERGAGNPLFLQELAGTAAPHEEAEELPETVGALVAARIDRLAPADRALLRWASVLGSSFSGSLVADVLADDPSAATDSEAWDRVAEFVERDPDVPGAFRFRHALIRDAAYEGLSFRRRRELHARVAEVVEQRLGAQADDAAELLSLHFLRAGRSAQAWRYSVTAASRAQEKWANVEAAEFYRRAIDASSDVPELAAADVAEMWERLGDCLRLAGDLDDAARAYGSARRLRPKDSQEQIALIRKEGLIRVDMGKYSDAIRWYGRGFKVADRLPDEAARTKARLELNVVYAEARFRQGEFRDCLRRCRAIVAEALPIGDLKSLAPAYLFLHVVNALLGSSERVQFRGLALPLYEELGDLRGQATALNNLGIEAYYEGDWVKALDVYERSRALSERIGDVTSVAMAKNNIGEILSDQGALDEAQRLFAETREACDAAGHRALSTLAHANVGRAAARAGRLDEAEALLNEALEKFRDIHATNFVLEAEARLAEVAALRGNRPEDALERAESVLKHTEDAADMPSLHAMALRLRAAARLQLGDATGAKADLEESVSSARSADALYELALALDLTAAAFADEAAATESAALLERLSVGHVARPPLDADAAE